MYYIYKLLREGPTGDAEADPGRHGQPADGVRRRRRQRHRQPGPEPVDEAMEPSNLALFWAGVIALRDPDLRHPGWLRSRRWHAVRHDQRRGQSRPDDGHASRPFWDGNETWLVVIGAGLFAAFPEVYAVFLGAFYLPVLLLLFGLIFRGIAFEFRYPQRAHASVLGQGVLPRLDRW